MDKIILFALLLAFSAMLLSGCTDGKSSSQPDKVYLQNETPVPASAKNSTPLPPIEISPAPATNNPNPAAATDTPASAPAPATNNPNPAAATDYPASAPAQNQSGRIPNITIAAPPEPDCSIDLGNGTITAGDSVTVTATARVGRGQTATYSCGTGENNLGTNGFFSETAACRYGTPGDYYVHVKVDGVICTAKPLHVQKSAAAAQNASCGILNGTIKKDYQENVFEAGVNYSGYPPNSALRVDCGWSNYRKTLGTQAFGSDTSSGIITVNCKYSGPQLVPDSMKIYVADDLCGEIKLK